MLAHTVSGDYDYEIPKGTMMRTRGDATDGNKDDVFNGRSLTLGGSILLKCYSKYKSKKVTFSNLIADGDGTDQSGRVSAGLDYCHFTLAGAVSVPEGKCFILNAEGAAAADYRSILVSAAVSGAGKILVGGNATGSTMTFKLHSTANFTGAIGTLAEASKQPNGMWLSVTGAFGGSVESLPDAAKVSAVKFNYDGLSSEKGLVVSSTTVPEALKTKLTLYSATADFVWTSQRLLTFPAGTVVNPKEFWVSYATSETGSTTFFPSLKTVVNADGTITLVTVVPPKPDPGPHGPWSADGAKSAFIAGLCTNIYRVESSPYATGGIIWKYGEEYIHIFTNVDAVAKFSASRRLTARLLLVAGGGAGGGKDGAAGGGAGGMIETNGVKLASGDYAVLVGRGAPAQIASQANGENGGNSSVSNATRAVVSVALGGGGGGLKYDKAADGANGRGSDGGSGGGAGIYCMKGVGKGEPGQGHDGGAYNGGTYSGGGGGAGSAGVDAINGKAGNGGAGLRTDILGSIVSFAGGGGGGSKGSKDSEGKGSDGGGNGGRGKWDAEYLRATDGVHGLGGGGGGSGGGDATHRYGAAGGDGLIVIRYPIPKSGFVLFIK